MGYHVYHPPKNLKALLLFDHVCIDRKEMPLSRNGCKYILVVVDVATRDQRSHALVEKFSTVFALQNFKESQMAE